MERSEDRMLAMAADLTAAGIAFERFEAIDGRALSWPDDPMITETIDLKKWVQCHHRNPIPADVGCYLSHLGAIRAVLAQKKPFGLIFEDDAVVAADFVRRVLPAVMDEDAFDILKLHARHPGPLVPRTVYSEDNVLASFLTKHAGATAYLITRQAAARMAEHMVPGVKMNDWAFDEGHKMGLRVRTLAPMPVTLRPVPSTIETERRKGKTRTGIERHADRPLAPRWALPFRRMADAVHRAVYNLTVDGGLVALIKSMGTPLPQATRPAAQAEDHAH